MDGAATHSRVSVSRILVSLLVVLVAGGVCAAAFAQWSSASAALPDGMFSSGGRALPGGSVHLGDHQLAPGDTVTGAATVTNDGDAAGHFVFAAVLPATTPGSGAARLQKALQVTLTDVTDGGRPQRVYAGQLSALSDLDLGSIAPGATRAYRIAVNLPAQPASDAVSAHGSLAVSFQWTAVTPD